jgi:hypothetical protein
VAARLRGAEEIAGDEGNFGGRSAKRAQELYGCTHVETSDSTHGGLITFSRQ